MDALTVVGIFMLGAAAGSIVSYAQHRNVVESYRKAIEELAAVRDATGILEADTTGAH